MGSVPSVGAVVGAAVSFTVGAGVGDTSGQMTTPQSSGTKSHESSSQIRVLRNVHSKKVKSSSAGVRPINTAGEFFYTVGGEIFFDICDMLELSSRDGRVY